MLFRAPEGYLGLASAAAAHGLTTQHRRAVWVVTTKRRRPTRIGETDVHFVHVRPDCFFGVTEQRVLGESVRISDIEKTALDCLAFGIGRFDFSELTAIVIAAARRWDWTKLKQYLQKLHDGPTTRRLGFLLATAKVEAPPDVAACMQEIGKASSRIKLDPKSRRGYRASVDKAWRVEANISPSDLFKV